MEKVIGSVLAFGGIAAFYLMGVENVIQMIKFNDTQATRIVLTAVFGGVWLIVLSVIQTLINKRKWWMR